MFRSCDAVLAAPGRWHTILLLFVLLASGCGTGSRHDAQESRRLFAVYCSSCHGKDGSGVEGAAPPLAGSSWVLGPEGRMIRIVLHGVRGRLRVKDRTYNLEMPGFGAVLTDAQIAAILSHVRELAGEPAAPIAEETVARVRAASADRTEYWTAEELEGIPDDQL